MRLSSNNHRRGRRRNPFTVEALEARVLLDASPVITEFMAINVGTQADEDGEFSDWIELYNPGPDEVHLDGWYLTDDAADLNQWRLPAVNLPANDYLLVFASGKDRSDPAQELHTNFKLDGDGEYLALVEPDGQTITSQFTPEFPRQHADYSYGAISGLIETELISPGDPATAFVPIDDSLGTDWTELGFNDSTWTGGTLGVGFETETGYEGEIGLDLSGGMFGNNASAFIRMPFQVDDPAAVDSLSLGMQYDDGFVAYLNGEQVVTRNTTLGGDNPAGGLLAYWPMNGTLEDTAADYSQNTGVTDNDLTGAGGTATRYVSGAVGQGVAVDQLSSDRDRLTAPSDVDFDIGGQFTIEAWIYPTTLSGYSGLAMLWDGAGKNSIFFALRNGSQLSLFHVDESGTQKSVVSGSGVVDLGANAGWQHVAVVGDGDNLRLYHNGAEVSAGSSGSDPVPTPTSYSGTTKTVAAQLGIGNSGGAPSSSYAFQGYFDEVAVWEVPLSADQLLSHYESSGAGYGLGGSGGSTISWDAAALADRPDAEALVFEDIDLTARRDLLLPGDNVLAIQGLNSAAADPDFLIVPELRAGRVVVHSDEYRYFDEPTPGEPNGEHMPGFVADTKFSIDRGFYDSPIDVEITSATPDVQIYYTTDGSAPSPTNGTLYTQPVHVATTTTLRAAAFKAGWVPTDVDTQTYVFIADVLQQGGMDPNVVGNTGQTHSVAEALVSIPAVSLVMDYEDLFGSNGIYTNATGRGDAWERSGSIEYFYPDEFEGYRAGDGFAITAGIRMTGGASRAGHNPKHSFRFTFKEEFGPTKLNSPVFEDTPVDRFDTLMLRVGHNQGWFTGQASSQYLRELYAFDIQKAAGQPAIHANFVHVYLNGTYWGLYWLHERPDDGYAEEHFGGDKEEYDVFKGQVATNATQALLINGTRDAWSAMFAIAERDLSDPVNYAEIQRYLDVDNLIDYIIGNNLSGEQDAPT